MKHILVTHEFAPFRGGVAIYCEEVAAAGRRMGADVEVWTPRSRGGSDDAAFPFPVIRLPGEGKLRPLDLLGLAWGCAVRRAAWRDAFVWLPSVGSQMVMMHGRPAGFLPRRYGVVVHGSEIPRFERNAWLRPLARRLFAGAARRAGASPYARQLMGESPLAAGMPVELACCGLRERVREKALQALGLERPDGRMAILALGRIHSRKGQRETALALALLPEAWKRRVVFVIAGTGDGIYLDEVRNLCGKAGVSCDYRGAVDEEEMDRLYRECCIFTQPSLSLKSGVEGLGMTNLEAAAYGKPVVGYDSGGVRDAVLSGETGLLAPEGDVTGLSHAIQTLLEDGALRQKMGRMGRAHAQQFDFAAAARVLFGGGE